MKFFLPTVDPDDAEEMYAKIARFVGAPMPPPEKRIRRIAYRHDGHDFTAEVGKPLPFYYQQPDQPVVAIFAGNPFKVWLPQRGTTEGVPIFVGNTTVRTIVYFAL